MSKTLGSQEVSQTTSAHLESVGVLAKDQIAFRLGDGGNPY